MKKLMSIFTAFYLYLFTCGVKKLKGGDNSKIKDAKKTEKRAESNFESHWTAIEEGK